MDELSLDKQLGIYKRRYTVTICSRSQRISVEIETGYLRKQIQIRW